MTERNEKIDSITYIIKKYDENKKRITVDDLMEILYLADWKNSLKEKKPITDITWWHGQYKPENRSAFEDIEKLSSYVIIFKSEDFPPVLKLRNRTIFEKLKFFFEKLKPFKIDSQTDKGVEVAETIKEAVEESIQKTPKEFIKSIINSPPMYVTEKNTPIDLVSIAEKYKNAISRITVEPNNLIPQS